MLLCSSERRLVDEHAVGRPALAGVSPGGVGVTAEGRGDIPPGARGNSRDARDHSAGAGGQRPADPNGRGVAAALRAGGVQAGPARGGRGCATGARQSGSDADGRRQVAVLPAARLGRSRAGSRGESTHRADGGSMAEVGRCRREGGDAGVGDAGGPQLEGAEGHRGRCDPARAGRAGAVRLRRLPGDAGAKASGAVRRGRGALRGGVGSRL